MSLSVAVVTGSMSRRSGGLFESVRHSARLVHKLGTNVDVFSIRDDFSTQDLEAWQPLKPKIFEPFVSPALGLGLGMRNALKVSKADLFHQHGIWQAFSIDVHRAARSSNRPVIISPRGMLDAWAVRNSRWKKRIAAWLYENANLADAACLHALTTAERQSIRDYGLQMPIAVIPNGIDPDIANAKPPPPSWAGQARSDKQTLLFLGRIHPKKGLVQLLKAIQLIGQSSEAGCWQFVIAGWDQFAHQRQLLTIARDLGVDSYVHFVGPQFGEAKFASLAFADAFILPSVSEGLPMAVLEAWAFALPVLMTPECNLSESFSQGAAIPIHSDPTSIAEGLETLFMLSEAERSAIGLRGQQLVRSQYSWKTVVSQMQSLYEWTVSRGPKPYFVE